MTINTYHFFYFDWYDEVIDQIFYSFEINSPLIMTR